MMLSRRFIGFFAALVLFVPALAQQATQQQDLQSQVENLEQQVFMLQQRLSELESTLGQSIVELERQQAFDSYRRQLEALRSRLEAGEAPEGATEEVTQIQENIGLQFTRAGDEAQERWAELNEQFETLSEQLRQGDAAATETLDNILADYDQTVQLTMRPEREPFTFERQAYQEFWTQLDTTNRANVLRQAESFLRGLRQDIEAGWMTEFTAEQIAWVRTAIASAYADPEAEEVEEVDEALTERGQELHDQLEQLEEQVRQNDPAASETYENVLERLRQELEREAQTERNM